ncbi:MAG: TonB-dependent receptor, partial [Bacteroidaceae bacterium]|nr:TonB-dependent receptor [Bacteroidaceae bacterium]
MRKRIMFYLATGWLALLSQPDYAQDVAREYDLQEIEVTARRHNFNARNVQMSTIAVSAERIRQLPRLLGEADVLKSLQTLPGVQSGGEGRAGIFVRGGDYDQNLFMLDGITLYNPEHLQGFTSAINADLVDDVVLYKGAFPSRFGSRLSSVIDISLREGDMQQYHASVTAGMLASGIQAEGPLWKGHTSFNIGARISYFNAIVSPLLKEVVYDNPGQMNNYSHMRYYDINAKLTHRFSETTKLNGMFYYGYDENNTTPSVTNQHFEYSEFNHKYNVDKTSFTDNSRNERTLNNWKNLLGGLSVTYWPNGSFQLDANVGYSGYDYRLSRLSALEKRTMLDLWGHGIDGAQLYSLTGTDRSTTYHSKIDDWSARLGFTVSLHDVHEIRLGLQGSIMSFRPSVASSYVSRLQQAISEDIIYQTTMDDGKYVFSENSKGHGLGSDFRLNSFSAFAEEDWTVTDWMKADVGLRLQVYGTDKKTHLMLEPRASLRLMLAESTSVKASYARMTQGVFLLSSGSMVSTSEMWMPVSRDMKPGISDQVSVGVSHDMAEGIQLSLEGYYKWLDNVADYREGVSFLAVREWTDAIAQGKGRAYGVEFLAQKTTGKTRGHISYTWSKSLRTFDRPGMEINGGREFYAAGDHRHNFNISVTQRLSRNWDLSASWSFQSGLRTNIAGTTVSHATLDEFNAYRPSWIDSDSYKGLDYTQNPNYSYYSDVYYEGTRVEDLVR